MDSEAFEVEGGTVTFVGCERVLGILFIELLHPLIARDFGEDAGGCDAEAFSIAVDDGGLRNGKIGYRQAVDEGVVGALSECGDGASHAVAGGLEDVEAIDFGGLDFDDCVKDVLVVEDLVEESVAGTSVEGF